MNRFDPPGGRPWGLFGLCGASLLLNLVLGTRLLMLPAGAPTQMDQPAEPMPAAVVADVHTSTTVPAVPVSVGTQADGDLTPSADVAPPAVPTPLESTRPEAVRVDALTVNHSLARTFREIGENGKFVSAFFSRLFVFDLDLRRDIQKGDVLDVAWEGTNTDAVVLAARYDSKKRGLLSAYRFHVPGETYPQWFDADGKEVSRRLLNGPIEGYEQITSLLHDRPTHRGMDFKADTGTPVVSGSAGVVTRTNWNTGANGNCVEVRYRDGVVAKYLHLSQTGVKPGEKVQRGAVLGLSGNTGRSTAPHLHYELAKNDKVIDPIDYHGVEQGTVPAEHRALFDAAVADMNSWFATR